MSRALRRGLIVAAIHLALVATLGAKLLIDRNTRPRVWTEVSPVDPYLPIRGRYVQLRIVGRADGPIDKWAHVTLDVRDGTLVFIPSETATALTASTTRLRDGRDAAILNQTLAYFIPEHGPDPSVRPEGEQLWVEVTVPRRGPPRPIRLGVMKSGVLTPLD